MDRKKSRGSTTHEYDKGKVKELISIIRSEIETQAYQKTKREWLLRNTRILEQYLDKTSMSRDKYMAENLEWIKEQNPESCLDRPEL